MHLDVEINVEKRNLCVVEEGKPRPLSNCWDALLIKKRQLTHFLIYQYQIIPNVILLTTNFNNQSRCLNFEINTVL